MSRGPPPAPVNPGSLSPWDYPGLKAAASTLATAICLTHASGGADRVDAEDLQQQQQSQSARTCHPGLLSQGCMHALVDHPLHASPTHKPTCMQAPATNQSACKPQPPTNMRASLSHQPICVQASATNQQSHYYACKAYLSHPMHARRSHQSRPACLPACLRWPCAPKAWATCRECAIYTPAVVSHGDHWQAAGMNT